MKKILIFITLVTFLAGCEGWLDVNKDPNFPTDVSVDLILPAAEASLAVLNSGNLFNVTGFFNQYWSQAPEANQYNTIETYDIRTDFLNNDYQELFAGALNDLERVRTDSKSDKQWGNYLAATVLRAYGFQVFVDFVDRSPYSEALQGVTKSNPEWENGEEVYAGLIQEIKSALDSITPASTVVPTDQVFAGDINQWIGFGNAMLLRLYMRQRFVNDVSADVIALINENNFMTEDASYKGFEDAIGKRNPWVETAKMLNTDANHVGTVNLVRFLQAKNDPRLQQIFDPAASGGLYTGIYPALKEVQTNLLTRNFSRPKFYPDKPAYFFTMSELYLLIAEAELVFNNDNNAAKDAYDAAIDYGLITWGLTPNPALYTAAGSAYYFDVTAHDTTLFEKIMMQKWVSLAAINNIEEYSEMRRTDIPKFYGNRTKYGNGTDYANYVGYYLLPAKSFLPSDVPYPVRLPYPDVAVTRNTNTPDLTGTQGFTNRVWWDVTK